MFDLSADATARASSVADLECIGVLSIDTETAIADTGWIPTQSGRALFAESQKWADIISKIIG
jgi:hypothetical protein